MNDISDAKAARSARVFTLAALVLTLLHFALAGCGKLAEEMETVQPPPAVKVTPVKKERVVQTVEGVGRTQAVEDVELKARVEGFLQERRFREGADVDEGQILFVIEQAPYRMEVQRLEAELAKARAEETRARLDLARIRELRERRTASQSELDAAVADERATSAEATARQAELERARLDLAYTEIRAPFAGRIGRSEYSLGDLINGDSHALATLVALDPIYVYWRVGEQIPLDYRRRAEKLIQDGRQTVRIAPRLRFPDGTFYDIPGRLDFLDNRVDPATGTQLARAVFSNPGRILLPGQYVNVVVEVGEPAERLLIPQAAVQQDRAGYFVLVVGDGDEAALRRVELGEREGTDWIVENGLADGERVIYQGIQKVQPGMQVAPVLQAPEPEASG